MNARRALSHHQSGSEIHARNCLELALAHANDEPRGLFRHFGERLVDGRECGARPLRELNIVIADDAQITRNPNQPPDSRAEPVSWPEARPSHGLRESAEYAA